MEGVKEGRMRGRMRSTRKTLSRELIQGAGVVKRQTIRKKGDKEDRMRD